MLMVFAITIPIVALIVGIGGYYLNHQSVKKARAKYDRAFQAKE